MKTENEVSTEKEVFIKMIVSAWETQNTRVNKLLETLSDEQLMSETAPGRNGRIYLLGHLTAVSDGMLPLLGWGAIVYPQLETIFATQPDNPAVSIPSVADIEKYWPNAKPKAPPQVKAMHPQ